MELLNQKALLRSKLIRFLEWEQFFKKGSGGGNQIRLLTKSRGDFVCFLNEKSYCDQTRFYIISSGFPVKCVAMLNLRTMTVPMEPAPPVVHLGERDHRPNSAAFKEEL